MARTKITSHPSHGRRWRLAADGVVFPHPPIKKTYIMSARKSAPGTGGVKLRRKCKAGVKAVREIKKAQEGVEFLIPRVCFRRLFKEIAQDYKTDNLITELAYIALQAAAEDYLTDLFEEMVRAAVHARRQTVKPKDFTFAVATLKRGSVRYR